ncbi:MAG: zinc metallopeptidase [Solirubrobacteraceae bacterium]|nr:zinc metallopeptidase [Solirubrobacteraceae bacterium]
MLPAAVALAIYVVVFFAVLIVRGRSQRAVVKAGGDSVPGLPTGAELAASMLESLGITGVRVVEADVDAYRAVTRELQLARAHARAATPAAWAIAAHEVAHAAQHRAGDKDWARWWVLSGHAVWAGIVLPLALLFAAFSSSPWPWIVAVPCALIVAGSGWLSWRTERTAVAAAKELLETALPSMHAASAEPALRHAARAYVAESVIDTGLIDRVAEPYRDQRYDDAADLEQGASSPDP